VDRRALGVGIFLVAFVAAGVLTYKWFSDDGPWIRFSQSGGIAGVSNDLTLEKNGEATLVGKTGATRSFSVPSELLAEVAKAAEAVDWSQAEGRHVEVGFDIFHYTFNVEGHVAVGGLQTNAERSLGPLSTALGEVIELGLKQ
jgi:hypothetical protein